ncbi:hypothetical protein AURDEDRAFT_117950 [Auricularia subglabra TFB-10046 SS5]|uniref:F-box domain-containing protein n=1 Tax=Auricularia subglabra (strain TFB-10046 / SS5) TaxID=717982 RepID=J0WMF0_AURST|nr:hypothetical protein AURDEDRAFT_117950 [Auricularia subglabra TFB-10046 SS5]
MRRLERVYWHGDGTLRQARLSHLRLLLSSPTLHTLTLSNVWLQADATDWDIAAAGLRTLRIDFSHQVQNRTRTEPAFVEAHLACLHSVLASLRPRLESLTLSGYSVRLSSLAAAPWPSLRVFSLTRGDAILDVPWSTFIDQMPSLTSFTVALDRGETPMVIFPDAATAHATPLSNLRHFTISFPHPDDPIFPNLPLDLHELALRDTPRYYTTRRHWRERVGFEPILSCPDVLRIFTALTATNLSALELVYLEGPEEFQMLALLAQSCPNLILLELHRYPAEPSLPDAWYHGTLSIPVDAIAESLAEFRSLRVLKLNLRFTDYEVARFVGTIPVDYWDRLAEFLDAQALAVALRVPWIKTLSILAWSRHIMCWYTWSVHPGGGAQALQVVYEDIYSESLDACADWSYY